MARPVAFNDQSARRIWRQVKADEQSRVPLESRHVDPPQVPKIYTMVRVETVPGTAESASLETIKAVFVSEEYTFDFAELVVTCNEDAPTIPDDALRYDVNHSAFIEGCVFVGDIFQAVNLGHAWYAIGCAHTAVLGTYDSTDASLLIPDCNSRKVPVQALTTDITLVDGTDYLAEWLRAQRIYVVTVAGCEEE